MQKSGRDEVRIIKDVPMVKRSNELIQAKYQATLRERKLLALSISKIEESIVGEYSDGAALAAATPKLFAVMSASEIKEALGLTGHDIYSYLKQLSSNAFQYSIMLEEKRADGTKKFSYIAMVTNASYDSRTGLFTVTFNDELKQHTLFARRYTSLPVVTLLSFKHNNTLRLFELLSVFLYKLKDESPNTVFQVTYSLAELRFLLGLINGLDDPAVRSARDKGCSYDYIWENVLQGNQPYREWGDFQKRVLEPAKREMQESELCNITFDYKPIKNGRKGKVTDVRFFLMLKQPKGKQNERVALDMKDDASAEVVASYATAETIQDLLNFTNGLLTRQEAADIIDAAGGNMIAVTLATNKVMEDRRVKKKAAKILELVSDGLLNLSRPLMEGSSETAGNHDAEISAEEELEYRLKESPYPIVTEMLAADFADDEINSLYMTASSKMRPGVVGLQNRDLWIGDYINHYYTLIRMTRKDTKTTLFRRLLDSLRKDYEGVADTLDEKYKKEI